MTNTANTAPEKPILQWVDVVRFLATFLVVLAHITDWGEQNRLASSFYYIISRIGVPIFFLISGYLLLSKEEDAYTFFRKRIARILIPFLVWSIVYDIINSGSFVDTGITFKAVVGLFVRIIRGPRSAHLWFFYYLIGLYLLVPILRVFVKHARTSELYYYVALWFLVMSILPIVEEFTPIRNGFEIYSTGGYVGYFLLGYSIGNLTPEPGNKLIRWGLGLFTIGFLFSLAVFYFELPPQDNELVFRSYPSLNIVLMSLGAFLLLRVFGEKSPPGLVSISSKGSQSSFGIYLVHVLVLSWMLTGWRAAGLDPQSGNPWIVIPIVALCAFLISWGCVYALRKIPVLQRMV